MATATTNTANTTVTDRTSSGIKPDGTPAVGTVSSGSSSGVTSVSSGSSNVTVTSTGGGGTGDVTISVTGGTGTVTSVASGTGLTGGPITTSGTLSIATTGVAAASYGTASSVPTIAVNSQGQITSASNTAIAISGSAVSGNISGNAANVTGTVAITNGGTGATTAAAARSNLGAGTVTSVSSGTGLSGGPITGSGTLSIANTGVTAATYGDATHVPQIAINSQGQITSASSVAITSGGTGTVTSVSSGNLSPIFTSSVATSTTTPAISYSLTNATAYTLLGNNTGSSASPAYNSLSSYIDNIGSAQGDILYRGATNWSVLTPGTSGQVLKTNGASANPSWTTVSTLPSGSQGQALLYGTSGAAFLGGIINSNTYSDIPSAATAAQTAGATLYVAPGSYTISSSVTFTCPIIIDGTITINSGVTLTLNGTVTAPLRQIFTVNGTLQIGNKTPYIYPEWFGATKNGSADDQPALNAALNAVTLASGSSSPIQFVVLSGTYYLNSSLTVSNSQMFKVVAGASFYPYGSYTGDCLIYQYNTNNTVTEIPTIQGFTTGAGLKILGCRVMKATGFMIKNCQYGVYLKASNGHELLDNYVNIHFIPDCQYGFYFTDDGTAATIQGNELYCNFYTNDNTSTNPWVIGGYADSIAACYWDNKNVYNWNGNSVQIKAIDINGATNSYGFYNASSFATYGGNSFLNGWQLGCPLWFGGINSHNLNSAYYMVGGFLDSEFRYAIQTPSSNAPYNLINIQGSSNRFIFARGGGNWNINTTNGLPQTYYQAQNTANSRSSFATTSVNNCAPYSNRIYCTYTISSTIAPNAELTLYIYTPITDAYIQSSIFAASNNFTVQPLANYGLIPETVYDNSSTNANEVVVKFRNVSGANISSGTFNFLVTVGL